MNATQRLPDQPAQSLVWMTISGLGFSLMSLGVKVLIGEVPGFTLIFLRSLINLVVVVCMIALTTGFAKDLVFPRGIRRTLVIRGLAGFSGLCCWFWALRWLPLSVASLLNWCAPLFTLLFSALFVGERVAPRKLFWVATSFVGLAILLKLNPTDLAKLHFSPIGVAIGLAGAAFGGIAYSAVRVATARTTPNVIVMYFVGTATLLSLPLALADWMWPNGRQALIILGIGLCATVGQISMTRAYRHAPAGIVSSMGLLTVAFTTAWGWLFLGESFEAIQWVGVAILGSSLTLLTVQRA